MVSYKACVSYSRIKLFYAVSGRTYGVTNDILYPRKPIFVKKIPRELDFFERRYSVARFDTVRFVAG